MVPMNAKVVLKSVSMKLGALFVMIFGTLPMHRLCATSLDLLGKVYPCIHFEKK